MEKPATGEFFEGFSEGSSDGVFGGGFFFFPEDSENAENAHRLRRVKANKALFAILFAP
jgi:hypothetical protein